MSDTLFRRRISDLLSEFTYSVLAAIRAASVEDLLAEAGEIRRPARRASQRAFGTAERRLRAAMAGADDPIQRYAAGEIVAAVKQNPDRYGDGAVAVLAATVGESVAGLYRFARVSEAWSRAEVRQLLAEDITWSHLVALAWNVKAERRAYWLERIKREHLTVRDLEIRLNP